jgi:response regulator RpfG family c-di-GMP phosphodiesterase
MNKRILIVDDEPNVLLSYKRSLRKKFDIDTAQSGDETLQKMADGERYALIVADMQMPKMNGVQLLEKVKTIDPDMVRIMLTGNADQQTAIDAINQGDIYRFLNKPCSNEIFSQAVEAGLKHHELLTLEHELLDKTLSGSIRVLAEVLSLANPEIFGRTARLQKLMRSVVEQLHIEKDWWIEPMVLLSQIGCVILPDKVSKKVAEGKPLATDDYQLYRKHPAVGASLLEKIPRMEVIAESIRYQEKCFDGTGIPNDEKEGLDIPFGARLLKVILDYEHAESMGLNTDQCMARMYKQSKWYDPTILNALRDAMLHNVPHVNRKVFVDDLYEGLVLAEDLRTVNGMLLISKGNPLTSSALHRLEEYLRTGQITGAVYVSMPSEHLYMAEHP